MYSLLTLASFSHALFALHILAVCSFSKLIKLLYKNVHYEILCSGKLVVYYNLFYLYISYYFYIYNISCYYEYLVVKIVVSNFHWFFEVDF